MKARTVIAILAGLFQCVEPEVLQRSRLCSFTPFAWMVKVCRPRQRRLRVASDCTGLNCAALALESLQLPYEEAWASDASPACRSVLETNYSIAHIYNDAREVPSALMGPIDFYSAGSPCPSFSRIGLQQGMASQDGQVILVVLRNLLRHRPRTFLLEQVPEFM